jgi:hypothetical protein
MVPQTLFYWRLFFNENGVFITYKIIKLVAIVDFLISVHFIWINNAKIIRINIYVKI